MYLLTFYYHEIFFAESQVQIVKKSGKHEIEIRIVNRHERSQKTAKKDYHWKTETKKW